MSKIRGETGGQVDPRYDDAVRDPGAKETQHSVPAGRCLISDGAAWNVPVSTDGLGGPPEDGACR